MTSCSLVIPVHNGAVTLEPLLLALASLDSEWEIIVVDDGSQDETASTLPARFPAVRWLRLAGNQGAAAARNHGASLATGELLVFVDSDVVVTPSTLLSMAGFLRERPEIDGVFGCYESPSSPSEPLLSRFRNLLHRYVHLHSPGPVGSFWTGLGAIRRATFERAGGFDPAVRGIEDVEFGSRIVNGGGKLYCEPRFQGQHLKRWNWKSFLFTDIFLRAVPWITLGLQGRTPNSGLNLTLGYKLAPPLLACVILLLACKPEAAWVAFAVYLLLNARIYRFMARDSLQLGPLSVVYLAVYHCCCLVGAGLGVAQFVLQQFVKKNRGVHHLPNQGERQERSPL